MINRYVIAGSLIALLLLFSITLSPKVTSDTLNRCESNYSILDLTIGDIVSLDDFDPIIDVALQAECGKLETGTCGLGACKDGWKCMDTGRSCLCAPPN